MRNRPGKNRGSADGGAVQQAQLHRGNHGFDLGAGTQPLVNRAHVRTDSVDTEAERQADVLVAVPLGEQLQDLALPLGDQLVRRGPSLANRRHARRAAPRPIEHELRDGAGHRHTAPEQLANRVGQSEDVLRQQVAPSAGFDHRGNALFVDRPGNDQQGGAIGAEQSAHLGNVLRPRVPERYDDGVGSHPRQLHPAIQQGLDDAHLDTAIGLQRLLGEAAIHPNQEDPRNGSFQDSRIPAAVHQVTGSYLAERVRPKLQAPQGFVTCFELGGNRAPDSLAVQRVSSLAQVEFWTVTGRKREHTQLSDMFSASLVLGANDQEECGLMWMRGKEQPFRSGDLLLAEADEIQRITPTDRPSALFTIYWERSVLECAGREFGLAGLPQWTTTRLAAGPLSADFVALQARLQSAADPEAIVQRYRAITAALLGTSESSTSVLRSNSCHPGVRRAVKRVRASFTESLSLTDLANELQMSKCHLARCFERSLGVPPHRYRRLLRLHSARRLLERGLSVGEAASETGFADAPHLTRAFREWLGVSPAAWGNAWRASDPWSKQVPQTIAPPKSP